MKEVNLFLFDEAMRNGWFSGTKTKGTRIIKWKLYYKEANKWRQGILGVNVSKTKQTYFMYITPNQIHSRSVVLKIMQLLSNF